MASLKDLFSPKKILTTTNLEESFLDIESLENLKQKVEQKRKVIPRIDFSTASNFCKYGSAELYYQNGVENIADNYPYDGSESEQIAFLNSLSYIDLYIFDNEYPRYNGYVTLSSTGWGSRVSTADGYGLPTNQEYISIRGTMNTASDGMAGLPLAQTFEYSNKYEDDIYGQNDVQSLSRNGTRTYNLLFDTSRGVTVEFWMKKNSFNTSLTEKEVLFDLWNGEASGSTSYGRFTVFLSGSTAGDVVKTTVMSGATGGTINYQNGSDGTTQVTTATIADSEWHHYAFTVRSDISNIYLKNYIDGKLANSTTTALPIGSITGSMKARIGALITSPSGSAAQAGAGKFSGSLDEFRYWKTERTAEQIAKFYITNVFGGANTDISNADLGVYYKFNEGITGTSSYDSVVLDYSGRISNGVWTGYPGSSARSTDSAMVQADVLGEETPDPVIYKNHPSYILKLNELIAKGISHDEENTASIEKTLPSFLFDDEKDNDGNLKKITHIISNTFDEIFLQIKEYNKVKDIIYGNAPTAEDGVDYKEYPFGQILLESFGIDSNELLYEESLLEFVRNRNDQQVYGKDLNEIKSQIYRNIYNNLFAISKSKGTEKSIRNFLRSLGVPEGIVNLNIYSDNKEFVIEDKFNNLAKKKKYINFNKENQTSSTLFQSASSNTNARGISYITGSINPFDSFTSEINILFPRKDFITGKYEKYITTFLTSSIFGIHIANDTASFDWPANVNDDNNFHLVAIRESQNSGHAKFALINRAGNTIAESGFYKDVYNNNEWTFAVSVFNSKQGISSNSGVVGASSASYSISLSGYNTEGYYIKNSFSVSASSTSSLITSNKRYFIGAEKQNFTGSTTFQTDVMVGYLRHYGSKLDEDTIIAHAKDRNLFGASDISRNKYLFADNASKTSFIPNLASLVFNIDFETITGSDNSGGFTTIDYSSGSTSTTSDHRNLYPIIGAEVATQYEFKGHGFPASSTSVIKKEATISSNIQLPEVINNSDLVNILTQDDEIYTRDFDPETIHIILEKSHGAVLSREMVNFFGNVEQFNNIVGHAASQYRGEYEKLEALRGLFFERVSTAVDFNRFFEFYKWIDDGIINFVKQLVPETSNFKDNVSNIIESHILERNKILYTFPMFDQKVEHSIGGNIQGTSELSYDWKHGHAPVDSAQNTNIKWWQERAESKGTISSGVTAIDKQRSIINNVQTNRNLREQSKLLTPSYEDYYKDSAANSDRPGTALFNVAINKQLSKNLDVIRNLVSKFTDAAQQITLVATNQPEVQTIDDSDLNKKTRLNFAVGTISGSDVAEVSPFANIDLAKIAQFSIYSSSLTDGYQSFNNGQTTKLDITNYHLDNYDGYSAVMQGPFTDTHVGGLQHRHQAVGTSGSNRAEAFKIAVSGSSVYIGPPQAYGSTLQSYNSATPLGIYTRDGHAKRPVNISNIKFNTSSSVLGNYTNEYEFLLLGGRSLHNSAFVKSEGFTAVSVPSPYISGTNEYVKPVRASNKFVIVERFSAPGGPETAGDSQGGPGLDYESAEFSPYNSLNFRNTTVRRNFNRDFLIDHSNYGGFDSDQHNSGSINYNPSVVTSASNYGTGSEYLGTSSIYGTGRPSFHKKNRNTRKKVYDTTAGDFVINTTVTRSVYDNEFIQTNVPNSDVQYSWIADSYSITNSKIVNYQSEDGYVSTSVGLIEELAFLSGSQKTARLDFVGLNLSSYSGSTISVAPTFDLTTLTLSSSLKGATINDLLLNNNGPYGYSSFKQNRTTDYRLARFLNQSNLFTFEEPADIIVGSNGEQKKPSFGINAVITQSILTSKYAPIEIEVSVGNKAYVLEAEYGNQKTFFHTPRIDTAMSLDSFAKISAYDSLHPALESGSENFRPDMMTYKETVWPKEENAYLSKSRQRNGFENNFWLDDYIERSIKGATTKKESAVRSDSDYPRSAWDLDVFPEFITSNFNTTGSPSLFNSESFSPPGILQNFTTFNRFENYGIHGNGLSPTSLLKIEPSYIRPQMIPLMRSTVAPHGIEYYYSGSILSGTAYQIDDPTITDMVELLDTYALSQINFVANFTSFVGSGQAKWQAAEQAGKYIKDGNGVITFQTESRNPAYNSYDDFISDIKVKAKDYAIIPEYRSSDFVSDSFTGKDIFSTQYNFSIPNTSGEGILDKDNETNKAEFYTTYTNSDFMKYFEIVKDKANEIDFQENSLTLRCKAIKKFIPYDGFYPAERTVQIAKQFFDSYGDGKTIVAEASEGSASTTNQYRPILQTFFAPGILYNTIKSGMAVDYPIFSKSYSDESRPLVKSSTINFFGIGSDFDTRVPFEAIYEPEKYINGLTIVDNEPLNRTKIGDGDGRLRNKIQNLSNSSLYKYMINNFLAESANLFLANGKPTTILSRPEEDFKNVNPGTPYGMRIRMFRSLKGTQLNSGTHGDFQVPQIRTVESLNVYPTIYIYVPSAYFDGIPRGESYPDEFYNINPGPFHNLTSSGGIKITISSSYGTGSVVSITSSKTNVPTSTQFAVYPVNNPATPIINDLQLAALSKSRQLTDRIMESLANAISLNSSASNIKATYLGKRFVRMSEDYSDISNSDLPANFGDSTTWNSTPLGNFLYSIKYDGSDSTVAPEMAVIEIKALDLNTLLNINISSSVTPLIPYLGSTIQGRKVSFFASSKLYGGISDQQVYANSISSQDSFMSNNVAISASEGVSGYDAAKESLTMYSRPTAFGPPVAGIATGSEAASVFSGAYDSGRGYNMPFTPPYYDGEAWMDIVYVPAFSFDNTAQPPYKPVISVGSSTGEVYALLNEVDPNKPLGSGSIGKHGTGIFYKNWRFDKLAGSNPGSDLPARDDRLNDNAMQLMSSINPFKVVTDEEGKKHWAIQLKYETPILNFNHLESNSELFYPNGLNSVSVPRGMWHQFGRIPKDNEGIYLQVSPIPSNWLKNHPSGVIGNYGIVSGSDIYSGIGLAGSGGAYAIYPFGNTSNPVAPAGSSDNKETLDNICGFNTDPVKLGVLPERKTISEAIVAVPYVEKDGKKNFFEISNRTGIEMILSKLGLATQPEGSSLDKERKAIKEVYSNSNSLEEQISKMTNYNIPPMFDFINRPEVTPVAMYIFEFKHTFTKDDLSYIWQNVAPEIGVKFEEAESSVTHSLMSNELLGDFDTQQTGIYINDNIRLPEQLKWMVFKVKQKAKSNYKKDILQEQTDFNDELYFKYNWPYDHFSLVELAKLSAEVEFVNKQDITPKIQREGFIRQIPPEITIPLIADEQFGAVVPSEPPKDRPKFKQVSNKDVVIKMPKDNNNNEIKLPGVDKK